LLECFKYYLNQTEIWTTTSILEECECTINHANNAEVEPANVEFSDDEEKDGKKEGKKANDEKENVPGVILEGVAGAIVMKSPDNEVGQGLARKRSASEDSSVPPRSSTKKEKKKSTTEELKINTEASKWIYAIGQPLMICMGLLDELMAVAKTGKAQSKIQSIQDKLSEIQTIKTKLAIYAKNHRA